MTTELVRQTNSWISCQMARLLIIDDDEDDVLLLSEAIENVWPEAVCETSSNNGPWKTLIRISPPTIIFIDAFSSIGQDCLKELQTINQNGEITIVVYTDEYRTSVLAEYKTLGANHILEKNDFEQLKTSLTFLRESFGASAKFVQQED